MKLDLHLYTNIFPVDGVMHISASITIFEDMEIIGMHAYPNAMTTDKSFRMALGLGRMVRDIADTLEKLGHTVELHDSLSRETNLQLGDELQRRVDSYVHQEPVDLPVEEDA